MGYKPPRTVYKLKFTDPKFEGLVVRAKSVPVGDMMKMVGLAELKFADTKQMTAEDLHNIDEIFTVFSRALVDWNVEDDDDKPVPATKGGLYTQELDFVLDIILAWMDAVASVSAPLAKTSQDGDLFPEELIPMETLSASLVS